MWMLALILGCGATDAPIASKPTEPTKDLRSSALQFPGDSPLAQFVPKGKPAQLTGPLGALRLGMPEADARRVATGIANPIRRPPDFDIAPGIKGVAGMLEGFDHVGFVAIVEGGAVTQIDVSAPLGYWDGVLETAWGPTETVRLPAGNPGARWKDADANLIVTFTNAGDGKAAVKWEPLDPALPVP